MSDKHQPYKSLAELLSAEETKLRLEAKSLAWDIMQLLGAALIVGAVAALAVHFGGRI